MAVNWECSEAEVIKLHQIAKRAVTLAANHGRKVDLIDINMDVSACHLNGCKLDLDKLLAADDFNFAHDVFGISNHINRVTGKIERHFLPRCSK